MRFPFAHVAEVCGASGFRCKVRVFAGPEGFPGQPEKAVATGIVPAAVGTLSVRVESRGVDEAAIAVAHDLDGDRTLDFNLRGIPSEPYGFSNGARGRFGPPSYEAAKVGLEGI